MKFFGSLFRHDSFAMVAHASELPYALYDRLLVGQRNIKIVFPVVRIVHHLRLVFDALLGDVFAVGYLAAVVIYLVEASVNDKQVFAKLVVLENASHVVAHPDCPYLAVLAIKEDVNIVCHAIVVVS